MGERVGPSTGATAPEFPQSTALKKKGLEV